MSKLTQLDLLNEASWKGLGKGLLKTAQIAAKHVLPQAYGAATTIAGHGKEIGQAFRSDDYKLKKFLQDYGYYVDPTKPLDVKWGQGIYKNVGSFENGVQQLVIDSEGKAIGKPFPTGEDPTVILQKQGDSYKILRGPSVRRPRKTSSGTPPAAAPAAAPVASTPAFGGRASTT